MPKIIINVNGEALSEPSLLQPREIIEYRWDRIIGAILLLSFMTAVLVWAGFSLFSTGNQAEQSLIPPAPAINQAPPAMEEKAENLASTPKQDTLTRSSTPITREQEPPGKEQTAQQNTSTTDRQPAVKSTPAHVRIHSPHIRHAQLTTNVVNRKPVDQLPTVVSMNERGLLRIYLYTETTDLDGRKLYHDWFLDGKRMARVQLPARQQPVSVSSSKFIDRYMTGNWTVNIRDDRNNLLGTANFAVTQ